MTLSDIIKNFKFSTGLKKFCIGAAIAAVTLVVNDPSVLSKLIPAHWFDLTLTGIIFEAGSYLMDILKKWKGEEPPAEEPPAEKPTV